MSKSTLYWTVIGLTSFTALVHLFLGLTNVNVGPMQTLGILWLLDGVGYLVLLGGFVGMTPVFKDHTSLSHFALMGYAALTIVVYIFVSGMLRGEPLGWLGPIDKLAEVLLIAAAYLHLRRTVTAV